MTAWRTQLLSVLWNLCFLAGAVCVVVGIYMAWRPGAWMFGGALLALIGFGGYRQTRMRHSRGARN